MVSIWERKMKMETEEPVFPTGGVNTGPDELPYADWDMRRSSQPKVTGEHTTDQLCRSIVLCKVEKNAQSSL